MDGLVWVPSIRSFTSLLPSLLGFFDQAYQVLQLLDSVLRVALITLITVWRELLEPDTDILF